MKTVSVLTALIPTLNAVRGGGAFNVVIGGQAPKVAEDLRVAANDDRLDVQELLGALGDLAAAQTFEEQQAAMVAAVQGADALLGAIADGSAPHAARVLPAARDLIARIATDVLSVRDVFRPDQAVLRRIRADASELTVLVDAEIRDGIRPEGDAVVAAKVYDQADRLANGDHGEREFAGAQVSREIARLAA